MLISKRTFCFNCEGEMVREELGKQVDAVFAQHVCTKCGSSHKYYYVQSYNSAIYYGHVPKVTHSQHWPDGRSEYYTC